MHTVAFAHHIHVRIGMQFLFSAAPAADDRLQTVQGIKINTESLTKKKINTKSFKFEIHAILYRKMKKSKVCFLDRRLEWTEDITDHHKAKKHNMQRQEHDYYKQS
jgi:hypothetical protein